MLTSDKLILGLVLLAPMPSLAGVVVNSPATGSALTNPVFFTATSSTATCSLGVASIGVYIDNILLNVVNGSQLSYSLVISPGTHNAVVEEWDKCGGATYSSMVITVSVTPSPIAAAPAFSLPTGVYGNAQLVALADVTAGATIYYTTDGSVPTPASSQYTTPIPVNLSQTINAIAVAPGFITSAVVSATYTITQPTAAPVFSLPAGAYTSAQSAILTDATPGAMIYYTTNGTTATSSSIRYVGPIPVSSSQTINAIAVAPGCAPSAMAAATYTVTLPTVAPSFSLPSGTYSSQQLVGMADSTPGAAIYYTTDGSVPNTSSRRYSGLIPVSANTTINAIAVAPNYSTSAVTSANYSITQATASPRFTLPSGTYTSVQAAMLSDSTPGGIIYYTMDGTAPSTSSNLYVSPIQIANTETIRAIASAPGYGNSPIVTAAYTVNLPTAVPTFSVASGSYTTIQSVALSDSTPGAVIHYTLNGSQPTIASPIYNSPLQVSTPQIVMAMAIAPGYTSSGPNRAYYNVKVSAPAGGPEIPTNAISAAALQVDPRWLFNHDPGTPGSSLGSKSNVNNPTISGSTGEFSSSYSNWGGEIYHLAFGKDASATNFVYDAQIWIAQGSQIGNLEMDMNQVISNGDTVIFAFQCNGNYGTWDYGANNGAIRTTRIGWVHSSAPCNPSNWSTNTWHHVQISYARDEVGTVTYNSVWLDGVEANIGATVPSAETLGWSEGTLLTNFQVDGVPAIAASVIFVDNLTISRW